MCVSARQFTHVAPNIFCRQRNPSTITMAQADPRIKKLKIQTGVVKRTAKEKEMYEKEAEQIEKKIACMEQEQKDEYDIKKQREVLQESKQMVPDTLKRLKKAYSELESLMEDAEKDYGETEEYKAAQTILESTKEVVEGRF